MSNRRRPRVQAVRGRTPPPRPGPGEHYASMPAVVADRTKPGALEFARQCSHEGLIAALGSARRSGIWWTEFVGAEAAKVFTDLCTSSDRGLTEHDLEGFGVLDENPRALLVVAWAITADGHPDQATPVGWMSDQDDRP